MKKYLAALAATALLFTACAGQKASKADLDEPEVGGNIVPKNFKTVSPDSITVFVNVDNHPNIVRLCLDGLAFRTVSTTYVSLNTPAVERVPEWDKLCPQPVAK